MFFGMAIFLVIASLFYLCFIFHAMGTNREVLLCAHIEQQSLEREFRLFQGYYTLD